MQNVTRFGTATEQDSLDEGANLYRQSLTIEPIYFAAGARSKDFIECYLNGSLAYLSPQDRQTLLTTSSPPAYLRFAIDMGRYYHTSLDEDINPLKSRLLKLYFNNDEQYFQTCWGRYKNADKPFPSEDRLSDIEDQIRAQTIAKIYFLLERDFKHSQEIDELLVIDNCFEKYLEKKLCFLHDLFLKAYLVARITGNPFILTQETIRQIIETAIEYPDDLLVHQLANNHTT